MKNKTIPTICYGCSKYGFNCPINGKVNQYALNCIHKTFLKSNRPTYECIKRYYRMSRKKGKANSEINSVIRAVFKKRGHHWFSSELSWHV